jgi:hypothetical protein
MKTRLVATALLFVLAYATDIHAQQPSIQGQVSAQGEAAPGAFVTAARVRFHDGRWRIVSKIVTTTNDDGVYRFDGLTAGKYRLNATVSNEPRPTSSIFFPLSPDDAAPAQLVTVDEGHMLSLDLSITRVPTARIAGRVLDVNGQPRTAPLYIMPSHRSGAIALPLHGASISPDGSFQFEQVPAGEWVIQSSEARRNPWTEGAFAGAYVPVEGRDISGVELRWKPGSSISGTLTFGNEEPIPQGPFVVFPAPADPDETPFVEAQLAHAEVRLDQTFELAGIHGSRRLVLSGAPSGWVMQRVIANGVDVTDKPIPFGTAGESLHNVQIVVTRRTSALQGRVVDEHGTSLAHAVVLLFSVDGTLRYPGSRFFRRTLTATDGTFRIATLAPGKYLVTGFPAADPLSSTGDDWQHPDTLEAWSKRATRVELGADERRILPALIAR